MRKQLINDQDLVANDSKTEEIVLQRYEHQKKQEQERRLRNIELQKKTIAGKIEADMQQEYENYDEMLRRKRDE